MGKEWTLPIWPSITPREAAGVLSQFPLTGNFDRILWHSPRPFSASCIVRTSEGEFVLKRHHKALRDAEALGEEHRLIAHLRANGLCVPVVQQTRNGGSTVENELGTIEVHKKSDGSDLYRDRQSWTGFLEQGHAFAAGRALAAFHKAASNYHAPARRPLPLVSSFTIVPDPNPIAAAARYIAERPHLASYLADKDWQTTLSDLFTNFGAGLSDGLKNQPTIWSHGDWHPSNLLWNEDGNVSTIFDFSLTAPTCPLFDLATAMERSCISWLEEEPAGNAHDAVNLVKGYQSLIPLSADDLDALIRLMPLVHVEFALTEVDYFIGLLSDPVQADVAWYDFLIGHADWFRQEAGAAFLSNIRKALLG